MNLNHHTTTRRAFTLLEVMLSVVLGAMVITTALGVFVTLQRAERRSEQHTATMYDLSLAHRALELSLRSMILSSSRPPAPATELPTNRSTPIAAPSAEDDDEPDFERPRVILAADPRGGSRAAMRWVAPDGRVTDIRPQRLEITIERPPVFAEPLPGETFVPVVRRMYASRHQRDRERRAEELRADRTTQGENNVESETETEPAIAAGVRGVFELTWEPQDLRPGDPINPEGGSWVLWYRTLPPMVDLSDAEAEVTEGLSDEELDRNPMYRGVRLASNLRWCKWEAVRAGETLSEFTSTWWEDLPAYVTLELQTTTGKWSKWMFEVQGTRGPEPGTVIGEEQPGAGVQPNNATLSNPVNGSETSGEDTGSDNSSRFQIRLNK